MSKEFEKNPVEMLHVSFGFYNSNEKIPEDVKNEIRDNVSLLKKVPDGKLMEAIYPFLDVNIFDHDLSDLVECGIYNFIYSMALSIVMGSRNSAFE